MSKRDELVAEATDLGLEFKGNISNAKLEEMIVEATTLKPVDETPPPSPAVKPEEQEAAEDEVVFESAKERAAAIASRKHAAKRKKISEAKKRAFEKHIVTITNKDPRENDVMTTAYLAFENQYFGLARLVPLDMPVELEAALIKIAAGCTMTLHKDEIVNGRRTGNKVPTRVKKYAISYSHQKPE